MIHCPSSLFSSSNTTLQIRTSGKLVCGKKAPSSHLINLPHCQESCPTRVQLQLLYCYSSIPLLLHHATASVTVYLHYYTMSTVFYCSCSPTSTTQCSASFSVTVLPLLLLHHATASLSPFFLSSILIQQETIQPLLSLFSCFTSYITVLGPTV